MICLPSVFEAPKKKPTYQLLRPFHRRAQIGTLDVSRFSMSHPKLRTRFRPELFRHPRSPSRNRTALPIAALSNSTPHCLAVRRTAYTRIPTFGDRSGGAGLRGWRRWGSGCGAGWGAGAAPSPSSAPAQPSPSPPQPQPCPAPVLWPLARATAGWPGGSGPNGSQGAPRCTLELKVRRLYYHLVTPYAAPATRSLSGAQSG